MNLRTLKTLLAPGLIAGLLASCAPEAPPLPESEDAMTAEDSDALQQEEVVAADGEALEDNAEDGPFPSGGDEATPEIQARRSRKTGVSPRRGAGAGAGPIRVSSRAQ